MRHSVKRMLRACDFLAVCLLCCAQMSLIWWACLYILRKSGKLLKIRQNDRTTSTIYTANIWLKWYADYIIRLVYSDSCTCVHPHTPNTCSYQFTCTWWSTNIVACLLFACMCSNCNFHDFQNTLLAEEKDKLRRELNKKSNLSDEEIEAILTQYTHQMSALEKKLGHERARQAAVSVIEL